MELAGPRTIEIVRDPEVRSGAPVLAGTRMGVHDIVSYAQLYDGDLTKVQADFPYLTLETLQAVMGWYEQNREEIDDILRRRRESYQRRLEQTRAARR